MRPLGPEPWSASISIPSSCASCRADGEDRTWCATETAGAGPAGVGTAGAGPGSSAALPRRSGGSTVLADDGERRADRHFGSRLDQHPLDHAAREDLDLDVRLVGMDDGDDVAAL